ncbi:tRNA (5-methylaminomethyl-2-thiouridine)(34)-methyltransferase MnmD [Halovulum dunhuangense]|uniref:tRNA (5-methylaminomethyl-2-thiouridine)(34)-methyltransferase MnmD n=1 Tax=Halovulum dunhuangense TaxID=1505036 RepID=A0A849L087_9RHOB|nr:tRNA (5-methylaminomethyl-2-thiouridine)(34)-methyltransferase MnmD [Halovulum dunhuangense]NNU79550.1 tRNA (5-methylaminomethyl-2-thiouridine)(34)-methyltransferase MnmD [Halovulum dunhuangense]
MDEGQPPSLEWPDGKLPFAIRFLDTYFSHRDGAEETRYVFLRGNDLPARARPGFHIAELGFGTGLNLLVTLQALLAAGIPGPIRYTSFEAYPMAAPDMARALSNWPDLAVRAAPLVAARERGETHIPLGPLDFHLVLGDARRTLPGWDGRADAWFLDGFAPARNPEMWEPALLAEVARHTAPGGTFATYTAAGHVRRALADAGFAVTREQGFGGKRHMSRGRLA